MWFSNHFLRFAPAARPLLLLLDGHSSLFCPDTIRLAAKERVILLVLPPHTTHFSQPLDKGCFSPLKLCWKEECHNFMTRNPGMTVSHYSFSELFSAAWLKAMTVQNIVGGFKVTGIFPLNRNAVKLPEQIHEKLAKQSGLAFIPLYSPARPRHLTSAAPGCELTPTQHQNKSLEVVQNRSEEPGQTDSMPCFDDSLDVPQRTMRRRSSSCPGSPSKSSFPYTQSVLLLRPHSVSFDNLLNIPSPPPRPVTQRVKSCGRVLTSAENLKLMEEKEEKKREDARKKEERQCLREQKRLAKEEEAKRKIELKKKKSSMNVKSRPKTPAFTAHEEELFRTQV